MANNKRTGLSALADAGNDGEDFSVIDAIGGPRGVIESMLPGVVFVVLFVATSNLNLTIAVSAVLAVSQVIVRLIQRQSVIDRKSTRLNSSHSSKHSFPTRRSSDLWCSSYCSWPRAI